MSNPSSSKMELTEEQKQACLCTPPSSITITKIGQPIQSSSRLRIIPQPMQSVQAVCTNSQQTINLSDPCCFLGGDQTINKPSFQSVECYDAPLQVNRQSTGVQQQQTNQARSNVIFTSAVKTSNTANNLLGQHNKPNNLQSAEKCLLSPTASCGLFSFISPQNKKQNNLRLKQQQQQQRISLAHLAMHRNMSPQVNSLNQGVSSFWQLNSCSKNIPEQTNNSTGVSRCVLVSPTSVQFKQVSSPRAIQYNQLANRNVIINQQPTVSSSRVVFQSRQNIQQNLNGLSSNVTSTAPMGVIRQLQQISSPNTVKLIDQQHFKHQVMQKSASLQTLSCGKQFTLSTQEKKEQQTQSIPQQQYPYQYDEIPQLLEIIPNYVQKNGLHQEEEDLKETRKRSENPLKLEDLLGNQKPIIIDQPLTSSPQVIPHKFINQSEDILHQDDSQLLQMKSMTVDPLTGEIPPKKHFLNLPDGRFYIGDLVQGKMDGLGELFNVHGKIIYEGEWQDGLYHGRGVLTSDEALQVLADTETADILKCNSLVNYKDFSNSEKFQTIYEGQFSFGLKEGAGIQHFSDGSQFFGGFSKGVIQGAGAFTTADKVNKKKITGIWNQQKLEVEFA